MLSTKALNQLEYPDFLFILLLQSHSTKESIFGIFTWLFSPWLLQPLCFPPSTWKKSLLFLFHFCFHPAVGLGSMLLSHLRRPRSVFPDEKAGLAVVSIQIFTPHWQRIHFRSPSRFGFELWNHLEFGRDNRSIMHDRAAGGQPLVFCQV